MKESSAKRANAMSTQAHLARVVCPCVVFGPALLIVTRTAAPLSVRRRLFGDKDDFIDDNFALLPRDVAPLVLRGVADAFEGCLPLVPPREVINFRVKPKPKPSQPGTASGQAASGGMPEGLVSGGVSTGAGVLHLGDGAVFDEILKALGGSSGGSQSPWGQRRRLAAQAQTPAAALGAGSVLTCFKRWRYSECRWEQALRAARNGTLRLAAFPFGGFNWVDCEEPDPNGPPCLRPERRERRDGFRGVPFLAGCLPSAAFPPAAILRAKDLGVTHGDRAAALVRAGGGSRAR